jgi:PAS domain S-box-containing protein
MHNYILDLIDFKKLDTLLKGFSKTTGLLSAISDLNGKILSKYEWNQISTNFNPVNSDSSEKCTINHTELAKKFADGEKHHFYKCLNGLVNVAVPIIINGEHIANLFSGQFFFEEPDRMFFKQQAKKHGFNEKEYLEMLIKIPVLSKEKVLVSMEFLLNMTQTICEISFQNLNKTALKKKASESEEKFRLLYDNSPDMFVSASPIDATMLLCNKTVLKKTGYTKEELVGSSIYKLYHNDCKEDAENAFQQFVKTGEVNNKELILKRKNGSKIDVSLNVFGIRDENGKIIYSMSSWRDITVRKKAEKELKESEAKFRTFSNISPVGVFVTDVEGKATYYNDKTNEIIGMPIDEGKGIGWTESIHPEDREKVLIEWNKSKEAKSKFELTYRFKNKHGKITWVIGQAVPMLNPNGELIGFVGSLFDITSLKQAEKELSNSFKREQNLANIVRNAPVAIAFAYPNGKIENCNKAFVDLVGYTEEELKKINWNEQLTPSHWNKIEAEALQKLTSKNDSIQYEKEYIHKNGTIIPIALFVYGNFDKNNKLVNFVGFIVDNTERKQLLKKLQNRNEFIESILEKIPIGFTVTNTKNGEVKFMNRLFENIYGWPKEVLTNNSLFFEKLFPEPEFREKMKIQAMEDMQSGDSNRMIWNDMKIVTSTGEERYVDAKNIFIADSDILISTVQDATKRKQGQIDLQESEIKYRSFFENSMDSILLTSPNGKILSANPATCKMLGYTENEIIQLGRKGLIDPLDPRVPELISRREKDGKVFGELTLLRKDRTPIQVEFTSAIFTNAYNQPYTCTIIRDVTERKKAEVAYKETVANLKSMIDNRDDSIWSIDCNYNYIIFNKTYENIINNHHNIKLKKGMDSRKLLTEEVAKFWIPKFESVFKGENISFEFSHVLNGETRHFLTSLNPIIEDSIITGASGLSIDITKQIKTQEQLILAKLKAEESDRLKTAFLHNISHEIRTPLNAIIGFSSILTKPSLAPNKRLYYSDIITKSSNQLLSIISNIISISSIEAGQEKLNLKNVNVNTICKLIYEQFSLIANKKNITLKYNTPLPDSEAFILLDETKFFQILSNLLDNAFKFIKQGHVHFGYKLKNGSLEFFVEDTGIGIDLDMQEIIFLRFRQVETSDSRNYGGSGLGLSISKGYVELHGGKIWLTSKLGKGTVFYFIVPYKTEQQTIKSSSKITTDIEVVNNKPITILIAEDEDFNFMLIEELLSNSNYKLIRAITGLETVEICKANLNIDLILMDIKMPVMNGYEATKLIKEFRPDLPIIAQTAYSIEKSIDKALSIGCCDYISKPFKKEELISKIMEQTQKS